MEKNKDLNPNPECVGTPSAHSLEVTDNNASSGNTSLVIESDSNNDKVNSEDWNKNFNESLNSVVRESNPFDTESNTIKNEGSLIEKTNREKFDFEESDDIEADLDSPLSAASPGFVPTPSAPPFEIERIERDEFPLNNLKMKSVNISPNSGDLNTSSRSTVESHHIPSTSFELDDCGKVPFESGRYISSVGSNSIFTSDLSETPLHRNKKLRVMIVPIAIILVALFFGTVFIAHKSSDDNNISDIVDEIKPMKIDEKINEDVDISDTNTVKQGLEDIITSNENSATDIILPREQPETEPSVSPIQFPIKNQPTVRPTSFENISAILVSEFELKEDKSFGYSVSISGEGSHIAISAPAFLDGRVTLYRENPMKAGSWLQYGFLQIGNRALALIGYSVDFSNDGTRLCVRALHTGAILGGIYVGLFEYGGSDDEPWKRINYWMLDSFNILETSVALSGSGEAVIMGYETGNGAKITVSSADIMYSFNPDDDFTMGKGAVSISDDGKRVVYRTGKSVVVAQYVFKNILRKYFEPLGDPIPIENDDGQYMSSVVMSGDGNFVVITSTINALVYSWIGAENKWKQFGNVISDNYNIYPPSASASFVPNSYDGRYTHRISIATIPKQTGTTLVKDNPSMVRVFEYQAESNRWIRISLIEGNEFPFGFGICSSLSADGQRLIVGAPKNQDNESEEIGGHVVVYDIYH